MLPIASTQGKFIFIGTQRGNSVYKTLLSIGKIFFNTMKNFFKDI